MCACGCFVVAGILAALTYLVMHGLWIPAIAVIGAAAVLSLLFTKAMPRKRN
jgi:hypothetical protein